MTEIEAIKVTVNGEEEKESNNGYHKVKLRNPNIECMTEDVLYHFALGTGTHDLKMMFGDVQFVCVGGSPRRMNSFAHFMMDQIKYRLPAGQALVNIAGATDRYALYKVGPVLCASHGMGIPSVSIMLHEIIKLVYHAGCKDVVFFRIGTSGGLGLKPGTVVVSESAVDAMLNPQLELAILGKLVKRPSILNLELAEELVACGKQDDAFETVLGKTMCTLDFYEGQARLDGAFCDYTEKEKMDFLHNAHKQGVRNIEMESLCFAAMCHHSNIRGAVVCVTLLDRFKGDQIQSSHDQLKEFDERPANILARYIRMRLGIKE